MRPTNGLIRVAPTSAAAAACCEHEFPLIRETRTSIMIAPGTEKIARSYCSEYLQLLKPVLAMTMPLM